MAIVSICGLTVNGVGEMRSVPHHHQLDEIFSSLFTGIRVSADPTDRLFLSVGSSRLEFRVEANAIGSWWCVGRII